eukprot:TRINITY_DN5631_c0_g1_i1.p1 TRINITY_DN5631_c0_g1~~TRINITY_DN5631_c0_g1_i1.p1  ORF type:complete len:188 (+),score=23.44 TRINITY_DN5631_c0_g1_i1:67-630(+)
MLSPMLVFRKSMNFTSDEGTREYNVEVVQREGQQCITVAFWTSLPEQFNEVTRMLGNRDHAGLASVKNGTNKFIQTESLKEDLSKIAFLMEYCRYWSIPKLVIIDSNQLNSSYSNEHPTRVEFDLTNFNPNPKDCCNPTKKCPMIGVISCSSCSITTWCSEECVLQSDDQHQALCATASRYIKELKL